MRSWVIKRTLPVFEMTQEQAFGLLLIGCLQEEPTCFYRWESTMSVDIFENNLRIY